MQKRQIYLILFLLIMLCIISFLVIYPQKKNSHKRRLVAVVNGTDIFLDNTNKIKKMIDVMNLHQLSDEQLRLAVQKHETESLLSDIKQTIINQKIKEYKLTVSDEEIQVRINSIFDNIDSNTANKIIEKSRASYEALQEWQKDPSNSDAIFKDKLAGLGFRIDQWELLQVTYSTPDELRKMQVPEDIDDMKKSTRESAKNDLLYQKLVDTVTKDTVTEDEIKEAYNQKYGHWDHEAPFDEVKEKIRDQLIEENQTAAMTIWLNEQYKTAKIELIDQKYKEVLNIISNNNDSQIN